MSGKIIKLAQAFRTDGWLNTLTGLGVKGKDKRIGVETQWDRPIELDLETTYSADDIARRAVDIIPQEALRERIEYRSTEENQGDLIENFRKFTDALYLCDRVRKAWSWGRLYGGSGLFIGADDGRNLDEPLDYSNPGNVTGLHVFHAYELNPVDTESDLNKPNFGLPINYHLSPHNRSPKQGSANEIHWTRIIRFDGESLPRHQFVQNNYWNDSVITKMFNALRNYNSAHDSLAAIIQDFRTNVIKIRDLASLLQEETGRDDLKLRIEIMNLCRSVINSVVLDAEDEAFENITTNMTNIPEAIDRIGDRLVAASGVPKTILFGLSPTGGLSGKGESEARDFYDHVKRARDEYLKPKLDLLFLLLQNAKNSPSKGKPIPGFYYEFPPLWQMDDKEVAETHKTQAEADNLYFSMGVVSPVELRESRFGGEDYDLNTKLIEGEEPEFQPEPKKGEAEGGP